MDHEISVEGGVVLVIVSGKASPEGYALVARDIFSLPDVRPGMKILVDYSGIDLSHVTGSDVTQYVLAISPYVAPFKDFLSSVRIACVNTKPLNYGLGRMWQIFMESLNNIRVGIFYTFEEAMNWLNTPDQCPSGNS